MTPWAEQAALVGRTEGDRAAWRFLLQEAERRVASGQDSFDIAMHLKQSNRAVDAVVVLSALCDLGPEHIRFHAMLERASCLRLLGEPAQAQAQLLLAREHDAGSHWPVQGLVEIAQGLNRTNEALALIDAAYASLRPDGKASLARKRAEILAAEQARHTLGNAAPRHSGPVDGLRRAGLVMMVKDEEDILDANLEHHHALGFRCFCILDNASTDTSAARISAFRDRHPDAVVLSVFDQIVGYYQSDKMAIFQDALPRYAALAGLPLDWMFFIDADEFIAFCGADDEAGRAALDAALRDPGATMLVMHWINAASPEMIQALLPGSDPFAVFTKRMTRLEPISPKIALRVGLGLQPMMGNHFVASYDHPLASMHVLACKDWYLMHYPLRSLQHVRAKVINGGRAFANSAGLETHGGHWRQRYDAYLRHGDDVLRQILQLHIDSVG